MNWLSIFCFCAVISSCGSSQKIQSSSLINGINVEPPNIDTIMIFRATGSTIEVNKRISTTIELYLEDYFKLAYRDSFLELIQSMGIYTVPEEYSAYLFSKIYESTHIRYIILPKITSVHEGSDGYEGAGFSRAILAVSYELHDIVLKKLLFTASLSGVGEWSSETNFASDLVGKLITPERHRNNNDNREFYRAAPLETLYKPLSLEATNELRKYLNIKHKYADLQ